MTLYLAVIILLSYLALIKCIYCRHRGTLVQSLKHVLSRDADGVGIRALVVTAHPDDECMFFAPTIVRLAELNASVHLLCLSEGNYYNQGAQRKQELLNSCTVLGIPASRITIVNHKKLPDDPKAEWSISLVSVEILKHIRAHSVNMVLTFDGRGVSSHANHIAIHNAVRHLASTGEVPNDCTLLSLVTVGLLRKYISFLDVPLSWLLPSCLCCIIGSQGYKQAKLAWRGLSVPPDELEEVAVEREVWASLPRYPHDPDLEQQKLALTRIERESGGPIAQLRKEDIKAAMLCHRTQLLWFRYLYITFSRYMFVNTFQTIPQGPKNLKIY